MTRRSIVGTIARSRYFQSRWLHRGVFAALILILGLLTFYPERYRAAATLTPTDPSQLGLSGTLGQLGAFNSVFGNQAAVEIALKVSRSIYVREIVIKNLRLDSRLGIHDRIELHRWLDDKVDVRSLRGGILQFEMKDRDPQLARDVIGAFASATQDRLSQISRRQTAYKRDVLMRLVTEASDRLARARSAYDSFRLQSRYANPQLQMAEVESRIPQLEGMIKAKEVELSTVRSFATDENFAVEQVQSELAALRRQLAEARATSPARSDTIGKLVQASTTTQRLQRELNIAQTLYDSYVRYLEGTSVEDLTSTANVRVLEPPYIDTARQINYAPAALVLALLLLWGAIEFYRLRPPPSDRRMLRDEYA